MGGVTIDNLVRVDHEEIHTQNIQRLAERFSHVPQAKIQSVYCEIRTGLEENAVVFQHIPQVTYNAAAKQLTKYNGKHMRSD
ncbi:hypothetical protein JXC34_04150 [Candidatus Woesearchaeota archaeon]|nr:hypothetical protein [Candidatus Woesearchaeota archaeon]